MKVDFTKFPLFTGIDRQDMVIADIRKDIADGIYRNVPGLPAHVLAEKIYRNELVELADDEIHILDLYTSVSFRTLEILQCYHPCECKHLARLEV